MSLPLRQVVPPLPANRQRSTCISSVPSFRRAIFPYRCIVLSDFRPCHTCSATFRPVPWLLPSGSGVRCSLGRGTGFPRCRSFSTVPFRLRTRHIPAVRSECTRTVSFHVYCLPLRAVGQPYPSGSCAYGVSAHPFSCVRPRGDQCCRKRNFALRLRAAYVLFQSPVCRNCAATSTAFHRSRYRLWAGTLITLRTRCVCIPDLPRACSAGTVSVRSCHRCV